MVNGLFLETNKMFGEKISQRRIKQGEQRQEDHKIVRKKKATLMDTVSNLVNCLNIKMQKRLRIDDTVWWWNTYFLVKVKTQVQDPALQNQNKWTNKRPQPTKQTNQKIQKPKQTRKNRTSDGYDMKNLYLRDSPRND